MALSGYAIAKHIQPSNFLLFYKLKEVFQKWVTRTFEKAGRD
jgi:hypothetical protein